jgi:hypothetical protein
VIALIYCPLEMLRHRCLQAVSVYGYGRWMRVRSGVAYVGRSLMWVASNVLGVVFLRPGGGWVCSGDAGDGPGEGDGASGAVSDRGRILGDLDRFPASARPTSRT